MASRCATQIPTKLLRNRRVHSELTVSIGEPTSPAVRRWPSLTFHSLDRTNFVQDILSRTTLDEYLSLVRREWRLSNTLWTHHRELWAENGDSLSRIYAGTGALNTSYTRSGKRTIAGMLSDATKSVSRAYINNFVDKDKQTAIDMFLVSILTYPSCVGYSQLFQGNLSNQRQVTIFDPIHDSVRAALEQRVSEYSTTKQCTFLIGTWNVNGRPPSGESLLDWLFPPQSTCHSSVYRTDPC